MVLSIIALILSLAAIAAALVFYRKAKKGIDENKADFKAVLASYQALRRELKEISIDGLEGVKYDHQTTTMTIGGNLVVKGSVSADGIKTE